MNYINIQDMVKRFNQYDELIRKNQQKINHKNRHSRSTNFESPNKADYRYLRYINLFINSIKNFEKDIREGIEKIQC